MAAMSLIDTYAYLSEFLPNGSGASVDEENTGNSEAQIVDSMTWIGITTGVPEFECPISREMDARGVGHFTVFARSWAYRLHRERSKDRIQEPESDDDGNKPERHEKIERFEVLLSGHDKFLPICV